MLDHSDLLQCGQHHGKCQGALRLHARDTAQKCQDMLVQDKTRQDKTVIMPLSASQANELSDLIPIRPGLHFTHRGGSPTPLYFVASTATLYWLYACKAGPDIKDSRVFGPCIADLPSF